jgi:hypothetical protein
VPKVFGRINFVPKNWWFFKLKKKLRKNLLVISSEKFCPQKFI